MAKKREQRREREKKVSLKLMEVQDRYVDK